MTDIFQAKEILRGHMCISGDVPAALLTLGSPDDVAAYCRRLIDEVGDGGGFMLTTGCECPVNVKAENLRAMVDTGRTYRGKKSTGKLPSPVAAEKEAVEVVMPEGAIALAFAKLRYDEIEGLVELAVREQADPWQHPGRMQGGHGAGGGALQLGGILPVRADHLGRDLQGSGGADSSPCWSRIRPPLPLVRWS